MAQTYRRILCSLYKYCRIKFYGIKDACKLSDKLGYMVAWVKKKNKSQKTGYIQPDVT